MFRNDNGCLLRGREDGLGSGSHAMNICFQLPWIKHTLQKRIRVDKLLALLLVLLLLFGLLLALQFRPLALPSLLGGQLSPRLDQVELTRRGDFQSGINKS